jgi:CBS domain-containing protein
MEGFMTIRAILAGRDANIVQVSPDADVGSVVQLLAQKRIGAVPVLEEGQIVGIFSERDVIHGVAASGGAALRVAVRDVMTTPAITVTADTPIMAALSLMTRRRIRHLPVVEGAELIGFISIGDLVKHRIDTIERDAAAMRDYIQSA